MNLPTRLSDALETHSGARFFRAALQVNPFHYANTYRGRTGAEDEEAYVDQLLQTCHELGVEILGLTDHNHVGSVEMISRKAALEGIVVFPGFEITSKEGVHFLCLFEPGTPEDVLVRYLGGLGIDDPDPNVDVASVTCEDVTRFVAERDGITIAAHATNDKGLLTTLEGKPRAAAWKDPNLLCAQIPGAVSDLPYNYRQIVENSDPEYARSAPPEPDLGMAIVNAKDVAAAEDLQDPAATCYIKMTDPSVEALKQAFLDPGSRIRLNSDPEPQEHARLVAMTWEGGFFDGIQVHFNENVNVLIGGRGTGKSTLIESIRFVLDLKPIGPKAAEVYEEVIKQVVQPGTKVTLLLYSPHPSPKHYVVERTYPNEPKVYDAEGESLALGPGELTPSLELLGQHEIGELTRDESLIARLLDRFVEDLSTHDARKAEALAELRTNREEIERLTRTEETQKKKFERLPALEERLDRYEEAGLEEKLSEKSGLIKEERVLDSVDEEIGKIRQATLSFKQSARVDLGVCSSEVISDLEGSEYLKELEAILRSLEEAIEQGLGEIQQALTHATEQASEARRVWQEEREQPVDEEYQKTLRSLKKESVDADEFVRLRKQVEGLRQVKKRLDQTTSKLTEAVTARSDFVDEWSDVLDTIFRAHQKAAKKVSRALKGVLRLNVIYEGNREPLYELLREQVGGRLSETVAALEESDDFSLLKVVRACRDGAEALREQFGLTSHQATSISELGETLFMRMEELVLPHTLRLELNVARPSEPPEWKPLSRLSSGQKATAALFLLLLKSDAPLIVDQPEDDLDNRFIAEGIVPRLREAKRRRQFVFATHNANIPVLGDAELILGLEAEGEGGSGVGQAEIRDEFRGSIDKPTIQELVEEVLEGGRDAFETRQRKYGF